MGEQELVVGCDASWEEVVVVICSGRAPLVEAVSALEETVAVGICSGMEEKPVLGISW